MRFLTDENFPLASAHELRLLGHDVVAVPEDEPGIRDIEILARAAREERVLLTFDRDFGELVFYRLLRAPPGIIHLRFDPIDPLEPIAWIMPIIESPEWEIIGKYTVVKRNRVRQRPLPTI